jgi:zinc protease
MRGARRLLFVALACLLVVGAPATAQVASWPAERPPRPLAPRPVKFPPYEVKTLQNGLQVIAVPHHEQPAVTLRLYVRAGSAQDPADKPGLAAMASTLLDQGTTTRSAEQIATAIDSIGGAMGTGSGADLTFATVAVMRNSFDTGLDLLAEVARNPAFAADEIDRQRQQILSALQVSREDPDYVAALVFSRLVYGFHPYGRPDTGTEASLQSISREDLLAFHKRWFGGNNAILAIVGDVTPQQAFAGAERAFGSWGRVEVGAVKAAEPPPPTRRVVVVDRPGAVQTEIRVGNLGLPRRHPDFLALDLAIKILGGEGGNRLHRVLRSERGLTYGAAANMAARKDSGHIVADTDTRSETTAETLRLLVDEIARLQRERVQRRELEDAQAYLTGSFPLTIETPGAIATQILNAVVYGLDLEELQTYRERVNAITPDDIQRVARQYLQPDRLSIVLVGDASTFMKQLAGVGFEQIERIPMAELDLTSPDLRRRAGIGPVPAAFGYRPTALLPQAGGRPTVDRAVSDLISRAVRAKGGRDVLRSVRTIRATSTTSILETPEGRVDIPTTTYIRYPGAFRVDAETPAGLLVQVFNAGEYWVKSGKRPAEAAPPPLASEMRGSIQRDTILLLLALDEGRLAARALPDARDGGRTLSALEVQAAGMRPVTVLLDPDTALIAGLRYGVEPDGGLVEESFSDYRDVRGLKVAFKAQVVRDGRPLIARAVRTFDYNVDLDAALFTRPG